MGTRTGCRYPALLAAALTVLPANPLVAAGPLEGRTVWSTVANSHDTIPDDPVGRTFHSFNQPSVNKHGQVVIRARSRGGQGQPAIHGIYTRNMAAPEESLQRVLDRNTHIAEPNNLDTRFVETPAFPRIDAQSGVIATRGNHPPVWQAVLPDGSETRFGTTGIYATPHGDLITGMSNTGHFEEFSFWQVPEFPGTRFEVFPGAPSVVEDTIVFKGNYTVAGLSKTGIYFRPLHAAPLTLSDGTELAPAGGEESVVLVANNTDSVIPGSTVVFGSVAPPSAADGKVVFAGFDDERAPTLGGIYLAPLANQPSVTPLVRIGDRVPGATGREAFTALGEGLAFDGRRVGFWGAWGDDSKTVRLYCPREGNRERIAYCNQSLVCPDTEQPAGDPNSVCDDTSDPMYGESCYQEVDVPVKQGILVHDLERHDTHLMARTGPRFDDFLFWTYSGRPPCGEDHGDTGEPVRWRASAFVAVSERDDRSGLAAFKAAKGGKVGIYLGMGPGRAVFKVVDTTDAGRSLDSEAPADSRVVDLGLEREGLRGDWLAISVKMGLENGTDDADAAGVYITRIGNLPAGI